MEKEEIRKRKTDKVIPKKEDRDKRDTIPINPQDKLDLGLCKWCCFLLLLPCAFLAVYLIITPCPIEPVATVISEKYPEMPSEEKIKRIQSPERLGLLGAECFVVHAASSKVYTGLVNGMIARFSPDLSEHNILLRTGTAALDDKYCARITFKPDPKCGRPLGMRLLDDDNLIVIDPFYGIFKINIVTLTKELVLDFKKTRIGKEIMFGDDLVLMPDNNTIFFTDVSDEHGLGDFMYAVAELSPRGRLFRYSLDSKELSLVAEDLFFSNGVELHRDGKSLLVTETSRARIIRVRTEDGSVEVFADNLIGLPDNIRRSPRGGYLVGLGSMRKWPFISDFTSAHPIVTTLLFKLFSTDFIKSVVSPKESLFIRVGEGGELLDMYYDERGEHILHISHAEEFQGFIYVGSFQHPYLLKIPV